MGGGEKSNSKIYQLIFQKTARFKSRDRKNNERKYIQAFLGLYKEKQMTR